MNTDVFDIVFIGNYTKDTIVSAAGTRVVDGGGFNYGAHVAAMMGLKAAAVTRLAKSDAHVVQQLEKIGVTVFPEYTPESTTLRLYYPGANPDERVLSVTHTAGSFTPEQVRALAAKAFVISASIRGEAGIDVIRELKRKRGLLAADVQGFVRIVAGDGRLVYDSWPGKEEIVSQFDILKTDAVEAEMLTGLTDKKAAARQMATWGPREIVLTHRDGVLVLADGEFFEAPFRPRELVGRSGRGDTCQAAYVAKRLSTPPAAATVWAAAVTSLKLEAEGPIRRTLAEVQRFLSYTA